MTGVKSTGPLFEDDMMNELEDGIHSALGTRNSASHRAFVETFRRMYMKRKIHS